MTALDIAAVTFFFVVFSPLTCQPKRGKNDIGTGRTKKNCMCSPNNVNGRKSEEGRADMEKAKVKLNSFVVFIGTHHRYKRETEGKSRTKNLMTLNIPIKTHEIVAGFCSSETKGFS